MSFLPKIYCVSLARAVDRRRRMIERLEKLRGGVNYEIVDAVDGSTYDLSSLGARLRQDVARRRRSRNLSRGEIGCYLSHYNLWQRLADENVRSAIVVEDDVNFSDDFLSVAGAANRIPYDWDVINFHTRKKKHAKNAQTLCAVGDSGHRVIRSAIQVIGTVCYLISASGVKQLLEHCFEINDHIDLAYSRYWASGIKYYAVYPKIVTEDASQTTITRSDKSCTLSEWLAGTIWRKKQKIAVKVYNRRHPLPAIQTGEYNEKIK